jgi:hypothetical protein
MILKMAKCSVPTSFHQQKFHVCEILPQVSLPLLYEPIATHSAPAVAAAVVAAAVAAARKKILD